MEPHEEALTDFTRAIDLDPGCGAIASRGQTYRLMGRYEEALADFNRAIDRPRATRGPSRTGADLPAWTATRRR